jgi:hypothetical protein
MVYIHTKNPFLGLFWRALEWKMLVGIFYDHLKYFWAINHNSWPFGIVCYHLVLFPRFWYVWN